MRNPEIKITERNVTGMRYGAPKTLWAAELAKLIMLVALAGIAALFAVAAGA